MYDAKTLRAAWVEVDLKSIEHNIEAIKKRVAGNAKIIGIIKGNAYGHGAVEVAKVLIKNDVNSLGVATLPEALELRAAGINSELLVLGIMEANCVDIAVEQDIDTVVCSYEYAKHLSAAAVAAGKTAKIYIAADTGMGRIGYMTYNAELIAEAVQEVKEIAKLPALEMKGLFSHFATADEADKTYANFQNKCFQEFYDALTAAGVALNGKVLANSAGVIDLDEAHYDVVRPGIILYGLYPSQAVDKSRLDLRPAMTVKARIVQLKKVPAGTSLGYGRKHTTDEERMIATLPLGYADGYTRAFWPHARVIINGCYAPVRGGICMDQCMVDVTDIADVKVGDEAIIMGRSGDLCISAEEIAAGSDTINYEITCRFGQRLGKIYV